MDEFFVNKIFVDYGALGVVNTDIFVVLADPLFPIISLLLVEREIYTLIIFLASILEPQDMSIKSRKVLSSFLVC